MLLCDYYSVFYKYKSSIKILDFSWNIARIYIYMYGEEEHVRVKSDMFNDSIYLFVVKFKIVMSIVLCSIKLRRSRINLEHWIPKLNLCWPGKSATKCKLSRTSSWWWTIIGNIHLYQSQNDCQICKFFPCKL
jgi:hypothetical protein